MTAKTTIAVVEDNPPQRLIFNRLLSSEFEIVEFATGEDFLASPMNYPVLLLDIGLPGIDGYEVCRRLRSSPRGEHVAVVFVSAHDTVEDRVAAFDAGADDFLLKPVSAAELRHKVHAMVEHQGRLADLAAQSSTAQKVAFDAMVNLGDQGVIIDFQRQTAMADSLDALAKALIDAISFLGLKGTVQVRGSKRELTIASNGNVSPLQSSVMAQLRSMGRIFEFKARLVINYDKVSIVVQNMPLDDPQRVGRYRDHLAILAESADISVDGVEACAEAKRLRQELESICADMSASLVKAQAGWRQGMADLQDCQLESLGRMEHRLGTMGLSEPQEQEMYEMAHSAQEEAFSRAEKLKACHEDLLPLSVRMHQLLAQ